MLVKLLSYNIKVGAETSLVEVARATASIGADIIALQEVGCRWLWGDRGDGVQTISSVTGLTHTRFAPALASFDRRAITPARPQEPARSGSKLN